MVLCYPIHRTSISFVNIMCKIFVRINKVKCVSAYVSGSTIPCSGLSEQCALDQWSLSI
jgi:hypothetical protein